MNKPIKFSDELELITLQLIQSDDEYENVSPSRYLG